LKLRRVEVVAMGYARGIDGLELWFGCK